MVTTNTKIKSLQDGDLFGEIALFTKLKRTATIICEDYSNSAYLNREDVKEIKDNFPHINRQFK